VFVSTERVRKLMRKAGLVPRQLRKFVRTSGSHHGYAVAGNLLEQDITADAPNRKCCGDIMYVWTKQGWLYHAVVIDRYNREVVGWAMSKTDRCRAGLRGDVDGTEVATPASKAGLSQRSRRTVCLRYLSDTARGMGRPSEYEPEGELL
jgi:putative transposase